MTEYNYDEWAQEGRIYSEVDIPLEDPSFDVDESLLIKSVRGTF